MTGGGPEGAGGRRPERPGVAGAAPRGVRRPGRGSGRPRTRCSGCSRRRSARRNEMSLLSLVSTKVILLSRIPLIQNLDFRFFRPNSEIRANSEIRLVLLFFSGVHLWFFSAFLAAGTAQLLERSWALLMLFFFFLCQRLAELSRDQDIS